MKLLVQTPPAELPAEALLARLRCRRATLDPAATQATGTPAANIVCWVYHRLNRRLRKRLEPFLDLLAMRSLVLTLRYTLAGEAASPALLKSSLLAEAIQKLVAPREDSEDIIAQLEAALVKDYPFAAGLTACYRQQGPGGMEQKLSAGILQQGLERSGNELLKQVLRYMVDMRNCLMIHKFWRWQVNQPPTLTAGGTIATASLQRIWANHDKDRLSSVTTRLAGVPLLSARTVSMEHCLLKGLTRLLWRAGREPLGLAVIIEYLWRAQLAAHNQVLRQALAVDRENLLEESLLL